MLKKVVEVQIDSTFVIIYEEKTQAGDQPKPISKSSNNKPVRIWIDLRIGN